MAVGGDPGAEGAIRGANSGITPVPLVLALAVPFLFLHIKYQPGVRVPLGSTHLGLELSDVAIVVVARAALRRGGAGIRAAPPCAAAVGRISCATPLDLHSRSQARSSTAVTADEVLRVRPARGRRRR